MEQAEGIKPTESKAVTACVRRVSGFRRVIGALVVAALLAGSSRGALGQGSFIFNTNWFSDNSVWTNNAFGLGTNGVLGLWMNGGPGLETNSLFQSYTNFLGQLGTNSIFQIAPSNLVSLVVVSWQAIGWQAPILYAWPPLDPSVVLPPVQFPWTNLVPVPPPSFYIGTILPPASNDSFGGCAEIPPGTIATNILLNGCWASSEPDEPLLRTGPAVGTLWWKWTPAFTRKVRLMASTPGGWKLEVFTGNDFQDLQLVASDRPQAFVPGKASVVRLTVNEGETYFIRLGASGGASASGSGVSIFLTGGALRLGPPRARLPGEVNFSLFASDSVVGTMVRTKFSLLPIARVNQPDGRTPLSGSKYQAQLYAGPTGGDLMPAGTAQPFFGDSVNGLPNGASSLKGVFVPSPVVVPNVIAGRRMFAQIRAWDSTFGATYEEAKANGGPVGESKILTTVAGSEETGPSQLHGIRSFSLREGSNPNP